MRIRKSIMILMSCLLDLSGCSKPVDDMKVEQLEERQNHMENKINIIVGDHILTATLLDNIPAQSLYEILEKSPITIDMSDYGGFEKVGQLPFSLPSQNENIQTEPGDLILYNNNSFVIYYGVNNWSLTRLGKIDDPSQLYEILGDGSVTVILEISN